MNQDRKSKKLMIVIGFVLFVGIFIYCFGERIASSTWFFEVFGIKEGNILNGRELDYKVAFSWRGLDLFLFGSGVGSFQKNENYEYIHNLFGQIYYEQGIYSLLFIIYVVLRTIKLFFKDQLKNNYVKLFILMLFCICKVSIHFIALFTEGLEAIRLL